MKEITKTFKIYEFKELSESAKEKAKSVYLNGKFKFDDLYNKLYYNLNVLFPNSNLGLQISLTHSQGDGVNIYGTMDLRDIFNLIKDNLSLKQQRILNNVFRKYVVNVDLPINYHYSYLKLLWNEIYDKIVGAIVYTGNDVTEIMDKTIILFSSMSYAYIFNWCCDMEDFGYRHLYNISNDEMEIISLDNDWYYLENGELYCD